MPYKPSIAVSPGQTFNRWTLIRLSHSDKQGKHWLCRCICGTERVVRQHAVIHGVSKSCGCLHEEVMQTLFVTHGGTRSPEYSSFQGMHSRCENPNDRRYKDYGGRGIRVCERWLHSFENFIADMGKRPSPKHTLERRNNDLGYSPENCIWASQKTQSRNKRTNVLFTFNGQTKVLPDWASEYGFKKGTLRSRIRKGWTIEKALTTPVGVHNLGQDNYHSTLSAADVQEIRSSIKAGVPLRTIAKKYKVTWSAIGAIKYKRTWKHLPDV